MTASRLQAIRRCKAGRDVQIYAFVNLYGCEVGDERIGTFVEIQKGAKIGDRCKISSHTSYAKASH